MFTLRLSAAVVAASLLSSIAMADDKPKAYATPEEAQQDPDFAVQGEYTGEKVGVQVVAQGDGKFRVVQYPGGLPGAGWEGKEKEVQELDTQAVLNLIAELPLTRVERHSPTLGQAPPEGAVVLFDGTTETLQQHWKPGAKITDDGLQQQGATSIDEHQDFTVHLEFRLPYMPSARGQGRGNSGYYLQGRYEIQMLDSFGLEGENNECGGIYSVSKPDVNMCMPPLAWQTYDVEFTAARFENGQKVKDPHAKVWHNGVVIHDRDIPKLTPAGPLNKEEDMPGPVYLQDHGNPVRYRNIWVVAR
jgi:hypothetical protein